MPLPGFFFPFCTPGTWFLDLGAIDIWGHVILGCGGCHGHCRMFSSLPTLYPLEAISVPPRSYDSEQTVIARCPLGGIIVPIENHCLRPVPSPPASLPQAPRQLHLPIMAGGERHPQICLLFHLPYSHQESGVRNQCPGLWVCLSVCLSLFPPFPSLLPICMVSSCNLEDATFPFFLPFKASCSVQ